jgi:hypothetical protein
MIEIKYTDIVEVVEQGWCAPDTCYKVMDATLAKAIAEKIAEMLWMKYDITVDYREQ